MRKCRKITAGLLAGVLLIGGICPVSLAATAVTEEIAVVGASHTIEALHLTYQDLGTDENGVMSISIDKFTDATATTFEFPTEISGVPVKVVTISNGAFSSCSALESISIPDTVTELGSCCFQYCRALQSVTIPDSVTVIPSGLFNSCSSLAEITLPDTITEVGKSAFYGTAIVKAQEEESVQYVSNWAVSSKSNLSSEEQAIVLADGTVGIADSTFNSSKLTSITFPDSLQYIGDSAFYRSTLYEDVTLPESLQTIGENAFYETDMAHVTASGAMQSIGTSAFASCKQLQTVDLSSGILEIGKTAFANCDYLKTVSLPESGMETIGEQAFLNDIVLDNVVIPDGVSAIPEECFSGCTALQNITIPDSVHQVEANAFEKTALTSAENTVYYADHWVIGKSSGLTDITIQEGTIGIADQALSWTSWKTAILPDGLLYIGYRAFYYCSSLKSIEIPESVIAIDDYAFSYCYNTNNITILSRDVEFGEGVFEIFSGTIYGYTGSTTQAYAEANNETFVALDSAVSGDPTGDDTIDVNDAVFTLTAYAKQAAGLESELTPVQQLAADVNGDGILDVSDAVAILTFYAKQAAGLEPTWEELKIGG